MKKLSLKNVGAPSTHQEIKRLRREVGDFLRRYGQPVVYFQAWNLDDVIAGTAKRCPACFDEVYAQAREDCLVCYGTTIVSVEDDPTQWIDSNGYLTHTDTGVPAPKYGAYREPVLTRVVEPDYSTDFFRINDQGVLVQTQDAAATAYWTPIMGDNDMLVNVTLGKNLSTVIDHDMRYLLKQVNPMTIRGWGAKVHDRKYIVGQQFQMNSLPKENIFQSVPLPISYGQI